MAFHQNEYGYIKFCLHADGKAEAMVYPDGGMKPTVIKTYAIMFTAEEAKELASAMYELCDAKGIWAADISTLDFDTVTGEYEFLFDGDEEEVW